jgi:cell division protein FtsB
MKKFSSQMKMFNPSYAASVSSFFATVRDLLIGMNLGRCLVVFMIIMSLLILFGNRGLVDNYMMKEKLTALKKSNEDVALENQDLKRNIALLRGDLSYIEMVSRNELGMVRKGDLVYRYAQ